MKNRINTKITNGIMITQGFIKLKRIGNVNFPIYPIFKIVCLKKPYISPYIKHPIKIPINPNKESILPSPRAAAD